MTPDHQGISFGGCSNVGTINEQCSYTQPITCDTTAGSPIVTIHGYTPGSSDIGKILVVGMPYKINGSNMTTGAGGTSWPGQTMRGVVSSAQGQEITLAVDSNAGSGNRIYVAGATVTGAECDLGTDNSPALLDAVSAAPANGGVCIPAGDYQFDGPVHISKNVTIFCEAGAVMVDPRNDGLGTGADNYFSKMFISFDDNVTGGGINGCTYMGTNTGIYWKQYATESDNNRFALVAGGSNLTFQNLTDLNTWGDSDIWLGTSDDSHFANHNTVENSFTQGGWAYGPSVGAGAYDNTFNNNVMLDVCHDVEPNNTTEANNTYGNTFENFTCKATGMYYNNASYPTNESIGGGGPYCGTNSTCASGQTVSGTNQVIGAVDVLRGCLNGSASGNYSGVTGSGNGTGDPACNCGGSCGF